MSYDTWNPSGAVLEHFWFHSKGSYLRHTETIYLCTSLCNLKTTTTTAATTKTNGNTLPIFQILEGRMVLWRRNPEERKLLWISPWGAKRNKSQQAAESRNRSQTPRTQKERYLYRGKEESTQNFNDVRNQWELLEWEGLVEELGSSGQMEPLFMQFI